MVVLLLIFWGTSILFSVMAVSIYIPTNSVQGFPFLHILTRNCYLFKKIMAILTGVRWYWVFDLRFPDTWWYWASFHVPVGHVCVVLGEMSVQILGPFWESVTFHVCCLDSSSLVGIGLYPLKRHSRSCSAGWLDLVAERGLPGAAIPEDHQKSESLCRSIGYFMLKWQAIPTSQWLNTFSIISSSYKVCDPGCFNLMVQLWEQPESWSGTVHSLIPEVIYICSVHKPLARPPHTAPSRGEGPRRRGPHVLGRGDLTSLSTSNVYPSHQLLLCRSPWPLVTASWNWKRGNDFIF